MGHFTEVHGYILAMSNHSEYNTDHIQQLPLVDTSPSLTRDMFATPRPGYDSHMISFGQSYNGVERYWETWLQKFEGVLKTLYWDEVHVHLKTDCWGTFHYEWIPGNKAVTIFDVEEWNPTQINPPWIFSGGPRTGLRDHYAP